MTNGNKTTESRTAGSDIPVRPDESACGYQTWTNLLFVHWRIPAEEIRPLVPDCLELDLLDGDAWLGLVPFQMTGVRPWRWLPTIPGASSFPETNVRTYVRHRGENPGVWFFSLDAFCRPAVEVARMFWHLPYFWSRMSVERSAESIRYESTRSDRRCNVEATVQIESSLGQVIRGDSANAPTQSPELDRTTELDRFLADRYTLYSVNKRGTLHSGDVFHSLYPLRSADLIQCGQTLTSAAGLPMSQEPDHVVFSEGVTVDIFALKPVRT